ncbi:LOW QUALITY PROTEIN: calnexin [Theropithecus gelada]|uniref:LOW QUALITY PROTEIN: calnexin n=1 Tax=Theropithecus gelada TaxID=9565 RepID=UPI000DC196DB|nr:LOW QUALITY PROTEIN: calnexin [Theropithecus gelada]
MTLQELRRRLTRRGAGHGWPARRPRCVLLTPIGARVRCNRPSLMADRRTPTPPACCRLPRQLRAPDASQVSAPATRRIMEGKWLLCMLLVLGTVIVEAHDGHDDDVIDIEDDLDDVIEEVEDSKPDTTAPPSSPKVTYKAPVPTGEVYFADSFDRGTLSGWILSKAKKDDTDDEIAKYDGKWEVDEMKESKLPGDKGLVLMSRAKHHAISAKLNKPFLFDTKPLIVQYEVNFQNGIECGGAYVNCFLKHQSFLKDQFHDKTPYTIMFGPDKCGEDYKLHFIFRHKNPKTGIYEEKHAKRPDADLKTYFTDKKTHLYTLILNPDNSFEILVDQSVVNSGNLLNDMTPPVNPSREIEDPEDRKPEDWDERPKIPDPEAVKPDDWDEDAPAKIPDEEATKPEGWLDDEPEYVPDPDAEKPEDW